MVLFGLQGYGSRQTWTLVSFCWPWYDRRIASNASNRLETGYALAQLILLLSAFTPSYLVVRGESWQKLQRYALWPAPILLAILILMVRGVIDSPLSEPWSIYAVFSAAITTAAILNHQHAVSDHVLWIGSIAIVIILTLLIPAEDENLARILLSCQAIVWVGWRC